MLINSLDDHGTWYSYHSLFAGALRAHLHRLEPGMIPDLYRRASCWHEEHGEAEEACHYALLSGMSPLVPGAPAPSSILHPVFWGDWQRRFHRREVMKLLRHQRVDIRLAETAPPTQSPPVRLLSRAERAHWRLSWKDPLARNARPKATPDVSIMLFGIPDAFAASLGLQIA